MKILVAVIVVHVFLGLVLWIKFSPSTLSPVAVSTAAPVEAEAVAPVPLPVTEPPKAAPAAATIVRDPMAPWTSYADGNTWAFATEEQKRALVGRLSISSRHGNSANYFYDALQEFYSEPTVRTQKLDLICNLVDAGGATLPARMRKY